MDQFAQNMEKTTGAHFISHNLFGAKGNPGASRTSYETTALPKSIGHRDKMASLHVTGGFFGQ